MRLARALVLLPLLAACGDDETEPPPEEPAGNARVHGGIVGLREQGEGMDPVPELGEVLLTIQGPLVPDAKETVYATGQLLVGSLVAPLAGQYDTTGKLTVDGADYFLTATTAGNVLRGTYQGPGSEGQVLLVRSQVFTFCGTFEAGVEAGGILVVQAADRTLTGVLASTKTGLMVSLTGKRTGDTVELSSTDADAFSLTGTVVSNQSVTDGSLSFRRGGGVWSASTGDCTAF